MSSVVHRYFAVAGAGTVSDADPSATQPGEDAEAQGVVSSALPLVVILKVGAPPPVFKFVVLDANGVPQGSGATTITTAVVARTMQRYDPPGAAGPRPAYVWHRGPVLSGSPVGLMVTQTQLPPGSAVAVIITAVVSPPAGGWIAIEVDT